MSGLGTKNNGQPGDIYVGFFNPLLTSYGDPSGEAYFMVTNGLGGDLQDASALVTDCRQDNVAYFTSHYDNLIGVAERDGIWLYSFATGRLEQLDLAASGAPRVRTLTDPDAAPRHQRLLSVYVATNLIGLLRRY